MNNDQAKAIVAKLGILAGYCKADKRKYLPEYLSSDMWFARVVQYTLDTSKTFKVSRVKENPAAAMEGNVFEFLDYLNEKPAANKHDKQELECLANQSPAHLDLVNRILRGRLDAGFDIKTIVEVAPGLVPYSPYCRCAGWEKMEKMDFSKGVISQVKADGMFQNVRVEGLVNYITTRKGNVLKIKGLKPLLTGHPTLTVYPYGASVVGMGEALLLDNNGAVMPRAEGNAIISQAIDNDMPEDIVDLLRFELWDVIPTEDFERGQCDVPYIRRYALLCDLVNHDSKATVIETKIVHSKEEAWEHYYDVRSRGLEGTICKDPKAVWFDGTSNLQAKLKAEKQCEVLVTGWYPGDPGGKYEHCIGSLLAQSSCGKLIGSVAGLTDEQRKRDPESWIGRIITVTFNAVSTSAKSDIRSFDHARIDGDVRTDKNVADDLEYILNSKEIRR